MTKFFKVVAVAALCVGGAMPAMAQMDVAGMTCGAFFGLDAAGRVEGTNAVLNFVKDTNNSAAAGTAATTLATATEAEAQKAIEVACEGQAVETNLLSVLK